VPRHDDEPLKDLLARSRDRAQQFNVWLDQLRAGNPALTEASLLYPADMGEWQAAVYLLTGRVEVWTALRAAVLADCSIEAVVNELEQPRRPWSSSEHTVMAWAAHFWNVDGPHPVGFPVQSEHFYFQRWITACHLYKRIAPALTITGRSEP
jgi:hypothetical protein